MHEIARQEQARAHDEGVLAGRAEREAKEWSRVEARDIRVERDLRAVAAVVDGAMQTTERVRIAEEHTGNQGETLRRPKAMLHSGLGTEKGGRHTRRGVLAAGATKGHAHGRRAAHHDLGEGRSIVGEVSTEANSDQREIP